jgi:multiple antibiotic resistance protein
MVVYFFGNLIFKVLGITVPAFQIGAGSLLFINSIHMVSGKRIEMVQDKEGDFAIIPLAIPLIVGPGTIGTLLVLGMEISEPAEKAIAAAAITLAVLTISVFLFMAVPIGKWLGHKGLAMMMKITGLMLTGIAAQIIFTGIKEFLWPSTNPL